MPEFGDLYINKEDDWRQEECTIWMYLNETTLMTLRAEPSYGWQVGETATVWPEYVREQMQPWTS